jgi:hypothetical protein
MESNALFVSGSLQQQGKESVVALSFDFPVAAEWLVLLQFPCFHPAAPL